MKRLLSALVLFFVLALCLAPTQAQAAQTASGTCGSNLSWVLENGVLTISGSGDMENYSEYSGGPWCSDNYSIRSVNIGENVTSIGNYAFYMCSRLTNVTIPGSVTSIGNDAFYNCIDLTSVSIPDSVTSIGAAAFRNCSSLTNAAIPGNVTSIGTEAFVGCPLTSVEIPGSVTYIGALAFHGCDDLKGIWVDAENLYYSSDEYGVLFDLEKTELIQAPGAISGSYSIPDSVAVIGESAFQFCHDLTDIKIPKSVTHIGEFAFSCCDGLTSVAMPNSITIIREYAFYQCDNLTKVTIPNSLTKIYKWVFAGCDKLASVIIPDSVKTIGYCAFSDCNSLSDVYYGGYKYQWNTIYIDAENECLTDAKIHYDGIQPYMHIYDAPEFIWDADYSCDAYFTCISCGEVQIIECTVKCAATTATCTQKGESRYTAEVVLSAEMYTDEKAVTTNALGHSYDGSGDAICNNCGEVREVVLVTTPMHRLYNPNSGEHFYTGSAAERDFLVNVGWNYEGIAWNAPTNFGTPVYRLYNPNSGDHHYTMSQEEVDMLVGVGWIYEGIGWNSASTDKLPLYRLYNPNADCGSHHYTGSTEERDFLVSVGWIYEGIGWFGMAS